MKIQRAKKRWEYLTYVEAHEIISVKTMHKSQGRRHDLNSRRWNLNLWKVMTTQ